MKQRFFLGWVLFWLGVAGALGSLRNRAVREMNPSPIEMVVEWDDISRCASAWGVSNASLLRDLRVQGVRGVVCEMSTAHSLSESGRLTWLSRGAAVPIFPELKAVAPSYNAVLATRDAALALQIERYLRLSQQSPLVLAASQTDETPLRLIAFRGAMSSVANWPLGFDGAPIEIVRAAGLEPVARFGNPNTLSPALLDAMLRDSQRAGARIWLPEGEVAGFASLLPLASQQMRKHRLALAWMETDNAQGAGEIARDAQGAVVRGHAAGALETARLERGELLDRLSRAARERNVRLLLLRLRRQAQNDGMGASARVQNLEFVGDLKREITADPLPWRGLRPHLQVGLARPVGVGSTSSRRAILARFVAGLGVVGAALLLANLAFEIEPRANLTNAFCGAALVLGLSFSPNWGAKIAALAGALAFPIVALMWSGLGDDFGLKCQATDFAEAPRNRAYKIPGCRAFGRASCGLAALQTSRKGRRFDTICNATSPQDARPKALQPGILYARFRGAISCASSPAIRQLHSRRNVLWRAFSVLTRATALSLAGGLIVAALLNSWTFQVKIFEFWGTKAASVVPVVLAAGALGGEFWPRQIERDGARAAWRRLELRLREWAPKPFPLRSILLTFLSVGVVALWLARSGNDSGVAVSSLEWKFRALLEAQFVARPRTKEFLLCHPAFILGALVWLGRRKSLGFGLLLLGLIGQISVVNSFAQANDPLYLPFWRTVLSLILAWIFGGILVWFAAPIYGFLPDLKPWQGWKKVRRAALTASVCGLAIGILTTSIVKRNQHRVYAELAALVPQATWPWPAAKHEILAPGVEHWLDTSSPDGTSLDLLAFDFAANSRLRFELSDSDLAATPRGQKPANRFAYWNSGLGQTARRLNARGDLIAAWNGGFWGLLNRKPRPADRAFHLSPVVIGGRVFYSGLNRRWSWGAKIVGGRPQFSLQHAPKEAVLRRDFDFATGALQALVKEGQPLEIPPYPWFGAAPLPSGLPSTSAQAGAISPLDDMHTSRVGAGWTRGGRLFVLIVKEPDGEAPSRAAVNARRRGSGGWTLRDHQNFWLSLRRGFDVQNAVGLDGGDVAQAVFRRPDGDFSLLVPRIATPEKAPATQRIVADPRFSAPSVKKLKGGALNYFVVRQIAPNSR